MLKEYERKPLEYFLEYYDEDLAYLLFDEQEEINDLYDDLLEQDEDISEWLMAMKNIVTIYMISAFMVGAATTILTAANLLILAQLIKTQTDYLDNFANDMQKKRDDFSKLPKDLQTYNPLSSSRYRAGMYTMASVNPFWRGKLKDRPVLPAYPGEGSECLTNCHCDWLEVVIDEDNGDFDYFWELGEAEHCPTCLKRSQLWNPLKVRNGVVLLDNET